MLQQIIFGLLAVIGLAATAQERLLTPGKVWITSDLRRTSSPDWYKTPVRMKWTVVKDTVECGRPAAIIRKEIEETGEYISEWTLCEKDGVISLTRYVSQSGSVSDATDSKYDLIPVIDFNVNVGDILDSYDSSGFVNSSEFFIVTEVSSLTIEGVVRKVIYIDNRSHSMSEKMVWIEGIGALGDSDFLVSRLMPTSSRSISWGNYLGLLEVYDGDKLIFSHDNWVTMTGIDRVEVEPDDETYGPVYDLQGSRVENPQPGHIYIRNGSKFRK